MTDIVNFYKVIPAKYTEKKQTYKHIDELKIELPARILLCGGSGSGKSNLLIYLLMKIGVFTHIYMYCKNLNQPLYKWFVDEMMEIEDKTGKNLLTVSDTLDDIPTDIDDYIPGSAIIFDDMITMKSKALARVSDLFVRGRTKRLSVIFISQSYYQIPSLIRANASYIILKKINTNKDLNRILAEYSLGVSKDELTKLYREAVKGGITNFFMIDTETNDESFKFRKNFEGLLEPVEN